MQDITKFVTSTVSRLGPNIQQHLLLTHELSQFLDQKVYAEETHYRCRELCQAMTQKFPDHGAVQGQVPYPTVASWDKYLENYRRMIPDLAQALEAIKDLRFLKLPFDDMEILRRVLVDTAMAELEIARASEVVAVWCRSDRRNESDEIHCSEEITLLEAMRNLAQHRQTYLNLTDTDGNGALERLADVINIRYGHCMGKEL